MAYLTHGAYRDHSATSPFRGKMFTRIVGGALVAIIAGASFVIISASAFAPTPNLAIATEKSDRLASEEMAPDTLTATSAGVQRDEARQTTTVARGSSVPFSALSPYLNDTK